MNLGRLKHSYAVAEKMVEIGKMRNYSEEELNDLFVLGYVHDIGYLYDNSKDHNILGGDMLKESNYKYYNEVYYHGKINSPYKSDYLDILNIADMMINHNGEDVGFDKRLEDIKNRYGETSIVYTNCANPINELKSRYGNEI